MAACTAAAMAVASPLTAPAALERSTFAGSAVLPSLAPARRAGKVSLQVVASSKKTNTKTPWGPSGDFREKVDAGGSPAKGKGVYQFAKKYGANVDGYSPIYTPKEWSSKGGTYEGGQAGLALWALTFAGVVGLGAILVYTTSGL